MGRERIGLATWKKGAVNRPTFRGIDFSRAGCAEAGGNQREQNDRGTPRHPSPKSR